MCIRTADVFVLVRAVVAVLVAVAHEDVRHALFGCRAAAVLALGTYLCRHKHTHVGCMYVQYMYVQYMYVHFVTNMYTYMYMYNN